jgi:putative copper export protein
LIGKYGIIYQKSGFTKIMRESVELVIRSIHLIAAIIWFGGVLFSTFIAMPILRQNLPPQDLLAVHNRFRTWIRLMIHVLLTTGAMVFFIVALNNGFFTQQRGSDFNIYVLTFVAKLAAFGLMALFWGLYSSLYRRHLEVTPPDSEAHHNQSPYINIWRGLTLIAGLIVFALAMLL